MSPGVSDAGGTVVISQMRPQNDEGNGPEEGPPNAPADLPKPIVAFYQGEPEVLGTTQIFTGILLISTGILLTVCHSYRPTALLYSGVTIWTGISYIISGSLSEAASVKPTLGKVRASLVVNLFSALFSLAAILIAIFDILVIRIFLSYLGREYCAYYKSDTQCYAVFSPVVVYDGIFIFYLMLWLLMACIAISTCVFACKTVCRSSYNEMHVVIYQTTASKVSDTTRDDHRDPSVALESDLKTQT